MANILADRPDTAEVNIPMAGGRGRRLDAEIARNVKRIAAERRAADTAARAGYRADLAKARSLMGEHGAAMIAKYGPRLGGATKVKVALGDMLRSQPAKFVAMVEKFKAEALNEGGDR